jgi:hypothetical protein
MDYNLILNQAEKLNKELNEPSKKYESEMIEKYNYLYKNVNSIFNICLKGDMDINVLTYMINQAKNIKNNKISQEDASVKIGEKLVDTYVKPLIDKENKNI